MSLDGPIVPGSVFWRDVAERMVKPAVYARYGLEGGVMARPYFAIGRTGLTSMYSRHARAEVWAREIKALRQTAGRSPDEVARVALRAADLGYCDAQALIAACFPRKAA